MGQITCHWSGRCHWGIFESLGEFFEIPRYMVQPYRSESPQPKRNYNMKFPAPPQKKIHKLLNLLFFVDCLFIFARKRGGPQGLGQDFWSGTCDSGLGEKSWWHPVTLGSLDAILTPYNNHSVPNYFKFVWVILNKFRKYVKINMEPKKWRWWKKMFLFNWVILRWTMLIFRGVYPPIPANSSGSFVFWPFSEPNLAKVKFLWIDPSSMQQVWVYHGKNVESRCWIFQKCWQTVDLTKLVY